MATQTPHRSAHDDTQRARLTLDIDAELHLRLKIAAAQQHQTMREYVEELLRAALPAVDHQTPAAEQGEQHTVSQAALENLLRTREAIMRGRTFSNTVDLLRADRDEREGRLG